MLGVGMINRNEKMIKGRKEAKFEKKKREEGSVSLTCKTLP